MAESFEYDACVRGTCASDFKTHAATRPYKCGRCDETFENREEYSSHCSAFAGKKGHKRRPLDKLFTLKKKPNPYEALLMNLEDYKKTDIVQWDPCRCDLCDAVFGNRSEMFSHKKTHGERPYKCEMCNKTFTRLGHLKSHHSTHSQERPFKCNICNKKFKYKYSINVHLREYCKVPKHQTVYVGKTECFDDRKIDENHQNHDVSLMKYGDESPSLKEETVSPFPDSKKWVVIKSEVVPEVKQEQIKSIEH